MKTLLVVALVLWAVALLYALTLLAWMSSKRRTWS